MLILVLLVSVIAVLVVFGAGVLSGSASLAAILLCCGWVLCAAGKRTQGCPKLLTVSTTGLVILLCLTAIPIPRFLDGICGSNRAHQNELARKALDKAADLHLVERSSQGIAVTRNRAGTMRIILLVVSGIAAAALSSYLPRAWKERYLKSLVLIVLLVAAAGYVSQWLIPQGKRIWWYFAVPHGQPVVGCFLNRNHFGGFVAMLCPAAGMLFADNIGRKRFMSAAVWGIASLLMGIAAIMSLSRGAWLAYAASMLTVTLLLFSRRKVVTGVGMVLLMAGVLWGVTRLSNEELENRAESMMNIQDNESAVMRLTTWADSLKIMPQYPFIGTGANGFRMVFPQYRTASTRKSFTNAENEYVQIPVEFGLIGVGLILIFSTSLVWTWLAKRDAAAPNRVIELSVAGAVVAVLVHASLDFALRVPLYSVAFASLLGLVISPDQEETRVSNSGRLHRIAVPIAGLLLAIIVASYGRRIYDFDSSDFFETAKAPDLGRALAWSPTSWEAWYHLGRISSSMFADGKTLQFGEQCITQAVAYDPNNYRLWEILVRVRLRRNDIEGAQAAYLRLKHLRDWVRIPELDSLNAGH
jgi:O-antigen ligase